MLCIAICDDEMKYRRETKKCIDNWSLTSNIPLRVFCYENGDDLISAQKTKPMDIIFLDIVMPLLDGINTAKELRDYDKTVKIIFLSSSQDFALQSYSVKASDYILKPISQERINEILSEYHCQFKGEEKCLVLKTDYGYQKIFLKSIEYLEAQNKRVLISMQNNQRIIISETLYSFEEKLLLQDGFFRCHRSFIVYLPSVDSFNNTEVTMKSGDVIPISRGLGKSFRESYFSFMFLD